MKNRVEMNIRETNKKFTMKKRMTVLAMMLGMATMAAVPAYAEEEPVKAAGAYEYYQEEGVPADAQVAFDKAMESFEGGENYTAVQLIDTQLVAGMNYRILCDVKQEEGKPAKQFLLTIYQDLDGNSEVTTEQKVVAPEKYEISLDDEKDYGVNVHFTTKDFNWDDNTLTAEVYQPALYDMVEMHDMECGTVVEVERMYITVETKDEGSFIRKMDDGSEAEYATLTINKDMNNECFFVADEGGKWIAVLDNDRTPMVRVSEVTVPMNENMILTDTTGNPGENIEVPFAELKDYITGLEGSYMGGFYPNDTHMEVANGEIVAIERSWRP